MWLSPSPSLVIEMTSALRLVIAFSSRKYMKLLSSKQTYAFRGLMVLILLASGASLVTPNNAQQRRKGLQNGEAAAAQLTETADKLAEAERWAEAIDAYKLVIRQHPKSGAAYKGLGDALLNTGKWEQALASYKEAVRVAPKDAEAWYDLGYWYNAMGRHGEAFDPLVKATQLDPGFAEAFYGVGYAYLRGSEVEKSLSWLKGAINVNPNYADAYYGLALAYTRLGKLNLAEEPRKKLVALDPALAHKLDKEIRRPQSELAKPLPPIARPEPAETVNQVLSRNAADAGNRSPETPLPTSLEARILPAKTDSVSPSEEVRNQTVTEERTPSSPITQPAGENSPVTQPAGENSPARPENSSSPQLPPAKTVPSAQTTVAPASSDTSLLTRVDGSAQPAPGESKVPVVFAGPVTVWPAKAKRWALLIGVDNYADEQTSDRHSSATDARTLADALVQYAGFPSDQVILLSSDQPLQLQPSSKTITQSLTGLRGRVPEDGLLLVSFAGHGIDHKGRSYLLPSDAPSLDDLSLLEFTAVNVERLKELIRNTGVKQVVLLVDASKNNLTPGRQSSDNPMTSAFSNSFKFDLNRREVTSFATVYATAVGQRAYEYRVKKQGYFTWALVEGLRGEAANDKGEVTLSGLVKYVQETVPKYVQRDLGAERLQVPFAVIEGYKADELVIANASKKSP
jgi:tetratricopeptide (TPR) repeat protein